MDAAVSLGKMKGFIGHSQLAAIGKVCYSEERQFMYAKLVELANIVETMPKTYETDGQDDPDVYLHYFLGGMNWHITERDMMPEQLQAFGRADLGYGGELGYISIVEITKAGAEIDLHWQKKPLSQCAD
ncbi:MAG: hypothetical protein PHQ60_02245 [Sideroxydans sp.]|nr:hypothetical protein [Sideroxydans sp.]MDD5056664.1 hypothetical protein [Sideroxydans sp.]